MKKSWIVRGFIAIALIGGLISPAAAEEMLFVTGGMSPPYSYQKGDAVVGMDVDTVKQFCESKGITAVFRAVPWKRALIEAEQGRAQGIMSMFRTDERENFLYFPDTPVNSVRTVVIGRKGEDVKVNSLDDLEGLRIGVLHAYKYGPEFDNLEGLNKVFCRDKRELITLLDRGRVAVTMDAADVFNFKVKEYGFDRSKFEFLYQVRENPVFIGFSKAALGERGQQLAAEFNAFFNELKDSGKLEEIRKPYK